jgi:prevent-host-death family protein
MRFAILPHALHLKRVRDPDILVTMTRILKASSSKKSPRPPGHWSLQDAKARFSELVRRVRTEGPQHVAVHGRDEVVAVATEEFHRLKGDRTGAALITALQTSPYRDIDIAPKRERLPVRDVKL